MAPKFHFNRFAIVKQNSKKMHKINILFSNSNLQLKLTLYKYILKLKNFARGKMTPKNSDQDV